MEILETLLILCLHSFMSSIRNLVSLPVFIHSLEGSTLVPTRAAKMMLRAFLDPVLESLLGPISGIWTIRLPECSSFL